MGIIAACALGIVVTVSVFAVVMSSISQFEEVQYVAAPSPTPRPTPRPTPSPTPTPEPTPDPMLGMVLSPLTGMPILEEREFVRPVAVVINNHSRALPQSGIAAANIIYEVLAEGNITRLVAIFHEYMPERVGPVRSTRDYFVDFALNSDAIFVHHGGSPSGYARLRNLGIDNFDGMALEGTMFWRDPTRRAQSGMFEHSSYTGGAELMAAMERRNTRATRLEDDNIGFNFNEMGLSFEALAMATGGEYRVANEFVVPFSVGYPRTFRYDETTETFFVYNVHGPHIDEDADVQIEVANVLVQLVNLRTVPGDGEGRREVTTTGSGNGYLATLGGIVNVRWERDSLSTPTRWYFMNGSPLQLSPGKIWICVLQNTAEVLIIEENVEEDEN